MKLTAALLLALAHGALAAEGAGDATQPGLTERWAVHGQFTYVEQRTLGFHAPYSGPNSLSPHKAAETTDATLYLGMRLSAGAEIWINPEVDQGFGLDNTVGAAGFPSGEAYKVGKNQPYLKLPRLFVRETLNLPGDSQSIDAAANQLRGRRSVNRWVFTVGKMSVGDLFDVNQYAHDPRGDFLNWAAVDAGTFDYAADAWGYTVGAAVEWYQGPWTLRAGLFDLSDVPNSEHLEPGFHEYQGIAELEKRHSIYGHSGKLMLTIFATRGRMGLLNEAVRLARQTGAPVDISDVRHYRTRLGADLDIEQQLTDQLGFFTRIGKAAGNVESYEFTDIDRTVSSGVSLNGSGWNRVHDTVGVVGILNGISADRQQYMNAGGLGILTGDGKLPHPGPENILETYYSATLLGHTQLTLDYQWINHPAYNTDRGPVSVFAVRLHAQF